jgi:hypothetical protein
MLQIADVRQMSPGVNALGVRVDDFICLTVAARLICFRRKVSSLSFDHFLARVGAG